MQLRNQPKLRDWPPDWGGSYEPGEKFAMGEGGTLKFPELGKGYIDIHAEFNGKAVLGRINSDDQGLLDRVCKAMNQHSGKSVKEIGDLEVGK